jgi:hypothetical protein
MVIRDAFAAIKSTGKPVKMEAEVVHGSPIPKLLEAARSAALVCVGATGLKHAVQGRIGSTSSALVASANWPGCSRADQRSPDNGRLRPCGGGRIIRQQRRLGARSVRIPASWRVAARANRMAAYSRRPASSRQSGRRESCGVCKA